MKLYLLPFLLFAYPAVGHESHKGMEYSAYCCNGNSQTGDCQAISSKNVTITPNGYAVTLNVGEHRLVTKPHRWIVPFGTERRSTDGDYHGCIFPDEDTLRCFYAPDMSF